LLSAGFFQTTMLDVHLRPPRPPSLCSATSSRAGWAQSRVFHLNSRICEGVVRGAGVAADVEGLVLREHEFQGLRDPLRIDRLAVHLERAASAEPEAGYVLLDI